MAGEFEPQVALLLACDEMVREHPKVFQDLVAAAHRDILLIGLVSDERTRRKALRLLSAREVPKTAVTFVRIEQDTMWIRDHGPFFVRLPTGGAAVVDADRTARCSEGDERVAADMSVVLALPRIVSPLAIEGGNLITNGDGLCVTTTALLGKGLFGDLDSIGGMLGQHFGFRRWVYVEPPPREETSHVDMFMTFLAPDLVVVARAGPGADPATAQSLDEAAALLAREKTSVGPMRVRRVPLGNCGDGVYRTYTNIIIANDVVLVPVYANDEPRTRRQVLGTYARLLPGRKVVGVNADSLAELGGGLRCVSMNVPGFVRLPKLKYQPVRPSVGIAGGAMSLEKLGGDAAPPAVCWDAPATGLRAGARTGVSVRKKE
jgi:agmatine/peptidylarginine deiminase